MSKGNEKREREKKKKKERKKGMQAKIRRKENYQANK